MRVLKYNEPLYLVCVSLFSACVHGGVMPVFAGIVMAKILGLLSVPEHILAQMFPGEIPMDALRREVNVRAIAMIFFALVCWISSFV